MQVNHFGNNTQTKSCKFINRCIFTTMEKNVLCHNRETNQYQSIFSRVITPEWMERTGFKPVEVPQEKPLLCEEVKVKSEPVEVIAPTVEDPVNKGGRPRKEKLN